MPQARPFPQRGSVYLVEFSPTVGREIRNARPAVVISNNHMNEVANTVIVMPITTGHFRYFHWIELQPPEGGMKKPSSIVTEQLRAVDKRRLKRRLGAVRPETIRRIEDSVRDHCGLPEGRVA